LPAPVAGHQQGCEDAKHATEVTMPATSEESVLTPDPLPYNPKNAPSITKLPKEEIK